MVSLIKAQSKHYAEIFQSLSILMAFVTKTEEGYKQLFYPVKCRDFLGDCIWSKKTNNAAQIYSFYFNYANTPYDTDMLRLSLTFPDIETRDTFMSQQDFLTHKEEQTQTNFTTFYITDDPLTIILEARPNMAK